MTLRGKLKIYFGYSVGVGTTYRMLKDAHEKMRMGVDVVVGYIKPNTCQETMELVEGLEVLPAKIVYNGFQRLYELNIEGALKRKPKIIIVDELAHTNAVGLKHEKRFQDIEELLSAGINVYTTLNALQLESLTEVITDITEVPVEEKVSDFIFDCAEKVEFIDIEPNELIKRCKEGKVIRYENAKLLSGAFKRKNLDLIREISLNRTLKRINECIRYLG